MQQFLKKQYLLSLALERVMKRLAYYESNKDGNDFTDWNQWHDLQYRLEYRMKENYSNYQSWNFNQYGFIAF
jgi:hypothetical protein